MAFTIPERQGAVYAPGYFLAGNEHVVRLTRTLSSESDSVVEAETGKYIPMGTIFYDENEDPEGIVYEDVDVTNGDMPGSVVLSGVVYTNRLPDELDSDDQAALEAKGFVFLEEAEVVRPE